MFWCRDYYGMFFAGTNTGYSGTGINTGYSGIGTIAVSWCRD